MCRGSEISVAMPGAWGLEQCVPTTQPSRQRNRTQSSMCTAGMTTTVRVRLPGWDERRDKEIRKQPSGNPNTSSGGSPALQQYPAIFATTGIYVRLFPYLLVLSFHSTPAICRPQYGFCQAPLTIRLQLNPDFDLGFTRSKFRIHAHVR